MYITANFAGFLPESLAHTLAGTLGVAQLGMAALGLAIPSLLGWNKGLSLLPQMLRRLFWVYAAYVFGTNLFFGIALLANPSILLAHGAASFVIALYLALFWGTRLILELSGFDRDAILEPRWARWSRWIPRARAALVLPLAGMTALYCCFAWRAMA